VKLNHDDMVANILAYYDSASEAQKAEGRNWYSVAGGIVATIAKATGTQENRVAYALAALSPRNPWRWNVFDAYSYAAARAEGRIMPKATTFKRNQLNAWQALAQDGQPWVSAAPKVRAFVAAILGDETAVVVDTWAYRVATLRKPSNVVRPNEYGPIAHAYNIAANLRGEAPAHMQAIVWVVAVTEGLASHRTGRHDLAFKAGTPEWLKAALASDSIA